MYNYSQYRVDIRHNGESILNPNNSSDKSQWLVPRLIMIEENLGVFPKIRIELDNFAIFGSNGVPSVIDWEDLSIIICGEESSTSSYYESIIAVTDMSLQGSSFILKGVCGCTLKELTEVGTSYLGTTLSDAINNLGMTTKFNIVGKVSGLSGEEYYRFNETKVQCLLRLLKGAANYGTFSITRDKITIINVGSYTQSSIKNFLVPIEYEIFSINNLISYNESSSSSSSNKADHRSNTINLNQVQDFTFDAYKDNGVPTVRDTFYMTDSYISRNNVEFTKNFVGNIRFNSRLDKLGTLSYNTIFEYDIGEYMNIEPIDRLPYMYAIIVGKIYWFDNGTLINKVLIGGVNGY